MNQKIFLNRKWKFIDDFSGSMLITPIEGGSWVEIPHTMRETPFHYYDADGSKCLGVYQRVFFAPKEWQGKVLLLTFEGMAHYGEVYINGVKLGTSQCGYTAFRVDISSKVKFDDENLITVRLDARAGLKQPPFVTEDSLRADYEICDLPVDEPAFGGIYRDVYLEIKESIYMEHVFYMPQTTLSPDTTSMNLERLSHYAIPGRIETRITLSKEAKRMAEDHRLTIRQYLNEHEISHQPLLADGKTVTLTGPVKIWDIDSPSCYRIQTDLIYNGVVADTHVTQIGFREAVFRESGFYLNGRRVKLRGIVRHEGFPYVGYAMPESIQRQDVRIIKEELYANAVRCAHCPPSPYFLDACDQLGLLAVVEIPGWKAVGEIDWKKQSLENVRDMITQHRNHPSVILWGTRINGAPDQEIDKKAVEIAHLLDPSRQTGGERLDQEMRSPEDVYTYSDYSFNGQNDPLESKETVTNDLDKPYLVYGYMGQSFPVRNTDGSNRKSEHMLRVARVLHAAIEAEDVCGTFVESMCDYATQAEFAAEDGIAYHGFLDIFRNHKPVTSVMAAQNRHVDVLEISSAMRSDRERWDGFGQVLLMTNADSVRVYRDDTFITEYTKKMALFENLRSGPIPLTDFIGNALEGAQGYSKDQTKRLKRMLNHMALHGLGAAYSEPGQMMDTLMTRFVYRMGKDEIAELYDRYISSRHTWRFEAIKDGAIVKKKILAPSRGIYLRTDISNANLIERHGYDVASVRVRVTDESSQVLSYFEESLSVRIEGPLELIGPAHIPFRGGMCGLYVKSIGIPGQADVFLSCPGANTVRIGFRILRAPETDI